MAAAALASQLAAEAHATLTRDLQELLRLCARSLAAAPIPSTSAGWLQLSRTEALKLAPTLGCVLFVCALPACALYERHARWAALRGPLAAAAPPASAASASAERSARRARDWSRRSYWLARLGLLRGMGLIYVSAFATSASQGRALYGPAGLFPPNLSLGRPVPAFSALHRLLGELQRAAFRTTLAAETETASGVSDGAVELVSYLGLALALLLLFGSPRLCLWAPLPAALWALYLSLVNLGSAAVINYGWEWATLEIGFLAIFLCAEWPPGSPFPRLLPPPAPVLWLFRWYMARFLLGAGLSKLGDGASACWRELSCTLTHYATQPMPSPLAWLMHRLPPSWHQAETALTLASQLLLPFLLLLPLRSARLTSFALSLFFEVGLMLTGNYAWINWVVAVPSLSLLDDDAIATAVALVAPATACAMAETAARADAQASALGQAPRARRRARGDTGGVIREAASPVLGLLRRSGVRAYRGWRVLLHAGLVMIIARKSVAPVRELFARSPWLHFYDDLFLVNAQGVFGFINSHRVVLTLEYSHHQAVTTSASSTARQESGCADAVGTVGSDAHGRSYTCAELAAAGACGAHPRLLASCPVACEVARCDGRMPQPTAELLTGKGAGEGAGEGAGKGSAGGEAGVAAWEPLDFANLPGDPRALPWWSSPYHHRLSWQVWISTTAALEHLAARDPATRGLAELRLPPFVRELIRRLLNGDADAVHLLAPTARRALRPRASGGAAEGSPAASEWGFAGPRAIRAQLWEYHFSSGSALLRRGEWWRREPLSAPVIYAQPPPAEGADPPPAQPTDTAGGDSVGGPRLVPWVRHRLLLLATLGVTAAADGLVRGYSPLFLGTGLLFHVSILCLVGTADYAALPTLAAALTPPPQLLAQLPARLRPAAVRLLEGAAAALARLQPHDAVWMTARLSASALSLAAAAAAWAGGRRALCVWRRPARECVAIALVPAGLCWSAAMAQ